MCAGLICLFKQTGRGSSFSPLSPDTDGFSAPLHLWLSHRACLPAYLPACQPACMPGCCQCQVLAHNTTVRQTSHTPVTFINLAISHRLYVIFILLTSSTSHLLSLQHVQSLQNVTAYKKRFTAYNICVCQDTQKQLHRKQITDYLFDLFNPLVPMYSYNRIRIEHLCLSTRTKGL